MLNLSLRRFKFYVVLSFKSLTEFAKRLTNSRSDAMRRSGARWLQQN